MWDLAFFITVLALFQVMSYYGQKTKRHRAYSNACTPPTVEETDILFKGSDGITEEQIRKILVKRFPYYRSLQENLQQTFLKRLRSFMSEKTFIIKDDEGFKEMPVLVSAAAIQLTFGLPQYRLPFYKYIRIHPEEYFAEHAFFTVLAGNVQGNIITVAWNQFLKGYNDIADGSNVGLHEMSHALYIQKMVIEEGYAKDFCRNYNQLLDYSKLAYKTEIDGQKNLYSEYADSNLQEFWAESVELFFEKPAQLKQQYPEVFKAMKLLLNQDPENIQYPLLTNYLSIHQRIKKQFLIFSKAS